MKAIRITSGKKCSLTSLCFLVISIFFLSGFFLSYAENQPADTPASNSTPAPLPKNVRVALKTSLGDIELELNTEKAPITVQNFLQYIESGFYNDTLFHRTIPKFMIQGGGFTKGMVEKKAQSPIKNEADNGLLNLRGAVGMARNQMVNSATSQFFINVVDNPYLDHRANIAKDFGYCVFGKVTKGMEVVDKISNVPTTTVGVYRNAPKQDVVILEAKRIK